MRSEIIMISGLSQSVTHLMLFFVIGDLTVAQGAPPSAVVPQKPPVAGDELCLFPSACLASPLFAQLFLESQKPSVAGNKLCLFPSAYWASPPNCSAGSSALRCRSHFSSMLKCGFSPFVGVRFPFHYNFFRNTVGKQATILTRVHIFAGVYECMHAQCTCGKLMII